MHRCIFVVAAASIAWVMGCDGAAPGGRGGGAPADPSTTGAGGDPRNAGGNEPGGFDTGIIGTPPIHPISTAGTACNLCSAALGGAVSGTLCGPSQKAFDDFLDCACASTCAAVCGNSAAGSCLAGWAGNPPLECKTCLVSATGCGNAWNACLADDGVTPPGNTSSSSGSGSACSCDPTVPLCPGGGSCATPGPGDGPGNEACGSAEYCAPCCDAGDACRAQGACAVTRADQAPCSMDYECCSGVCTAGACDGGCGTLFSF